MLPKKTILISAVLTTFVLSMLGGVAMALKGPSASTVAAAPTLMASLTPQEAAAVASAVLNQQDVYSVENSTINGVDAYKVVFSSGQVAFVGLDGQILSITEIQPVVVVQDNGAPAQTSSDSGPSFVSSRSGGEHEGDDHEEHEDHDD